MEILRLTPWRLALSDTPDKWPSPASPPSARRQPTLMRSHSRYLRSFPPSNCDFKMVNRSATARVLLRPTRHSYLHRRALRHTLGSNKLPLPDLDTTTPRPQRRKHR